MKKIIFGVIIGILLIGMLSINILAEDNYDTSCELDDDCVIVNKERITACCGSCVQEDYASDNFIGINKDWVNEQRNCSIPLICPACITPMPLNFGNYIVKCINNKCTKTAETETCSSPVCDEGVEPYFTGEYDNNGCKIYKCPGTTCTACVGGTPTGQYDDDGCEIYECPPGIGCQNSPSCANAINKGVDSSGCIIWECPDETEEGETATCPGGCICSGETITCPTQEGETIDVEVDEGPTQGQTGEQDTGSISITIQENKIKIKSGEVEVVTSEKVSIIESTLTMQTSAGNKEIKVLPETATISSKIESIDTVELIEENDKPVYSVSGTSTGRLIFIFPITAGVQTQVDAETGEIISTEKPWWSFLVFGI